ncbi:MAG: leucine-rich repeat protein, partial [Oscillospiraceae bacterium]
TIKIPESVTKIGSSAFFNCRELHEITIPDGVTSISDFAFWCCDANVTYKGKTYSSTYYYGLYNEINGDPLYSLYNSYFR